MVNESATCMVPVHWLLRRRHGFTICLLYTISCMPSPVDATPSTFAHSWSPTCDEFLAAAPIIEIAGRTSIVVTGRCNATLAESTPAVILDVTNCTDAVTIEFDGVTIEYPSIAVQSNGCAGVASVLITVRNSSMRAAGWYPSHPLGDGSAALLDVIATCDRPNWTRPFAAMNVTIMLLDSVLSADTDQNSSSSGGASVGVIHVLGMEGDNPSANVFNVYFIARRSVLIANGSAAAAVFCVHGASGMNRSMPPLQAVGVAMAVDSSSLLAHRSAHGGYALCGVLTVRCDAGVSVSFLAITVVNSSLAATADNEGWVGTATVLAANGSASLTSSQHIIVSSVVLAVAGRRVIGDFASAVAANVAVIAGMCPTTAAAAAMPRHAVWGELEAKNSTGTEPHFDFLTLVPPHHNATDASHSGAPQRERERTLMYVSITASTIVGFGHSVVVNVGVMLFSESECATSNALMSTQGLVRLGAIPSDNTTATSTVDEAGIGATILIVANGTNLTASSLYYFALNVAVGLGFGNGTVQWSVVGPTALLVVCGKDTSVTAVSYNVAVVVGAGMWGSDVGVLGAAVSFYVARRGLICVVAGSAVSATIPNDASYRYLAVAIGVGIVYHGLGRWGVRWFQTNDSAIIVWGNASVTATAGVEDTAVAIGAACWRSGRVTVAGHVTWIVAEVATVASTGAVLGFTNDYAAGVSFLFLASPDARIRAYMCGATILFQGGVAQAFSVRNIDAGNVPTDLSGPWFTAILCNMTSGAPPLSYASLTLSCAAPVFTDAWLSNESTAPLPSAADDVLFKLLLGASETNVGSMSFASSSSCAATLYDGIRLYAPTMASVWALSLSMEQSVMRADDQTWWWTPFAPSAAASTTVAGTDTVLSGASSASTSATITSARSSDIVVTTAQVTNWTRPAASSAAASFSIVPTVLSTTGTSGRGRPPGTAFSSPAAWSLTATSTTTTTAEAAVAIDASVAHVGDAASHVVVATAFASLVGAPQSVSRGPQALRLLSLRRSCKSRLTHDALANLRSPDPKQYVAVVKLWGSAALGALTSSAGLLVATSFITIGLWMLCRGRPKFARTLLKAIASLHVAATVYYGPNVAAGAAAVAQSTEANSVGVDSGHLPTARGVVGACGCVVVAGVIMFLLAVRGTPVGRTEHVD